MDHDMALQLPPHKPPKPPRLPLQAYSEQTLASQRQEAQAQSTLFATTAQALQAWTRPATTLGLADKAAQAHVQAVHCPSTRRGLRPTHGSSASQPKDRQAKPTQTYTLTLDPSPCPCAQTRFSLPDWSQIKPARSIVRPTVESEIFSPFSANLTCLSSNFALVVHYTYTIQRDAYQLSFSTMNDDPYLSRYVTDLTNAFA